MVLLVMIVMSSQVSAKSFKLHVNSKKLIQGIIHVENPRRDPNAVGDKHMKNKAYGLLQIRKPYLDDVNRIAGKKETRRKWGKDKLTLHDMKNLAMAKWAFMVYSSYYGKVYTQITGKTPTMDVYSRNHNGGGFGWKKQSTVKYGKAVVKFAKAKSRTQKNG